jgi:hypothetical protein
MIGKYSINFFLSALFFMLAMPALAFAQSSPGVASASAKEAQILLSAFMAFTDLRIRSIQRSLEILASTTEAKSGEWRNMKGLLSSYQKSDEGLIVWFARTDGSYYTVDKDLVKATLRDRSYFPDLMAGRKITAALVVSKSTGRRSAVIAVPFKKNGKIAGAIGASLFLDRLSEQINATLEFPTNVSFFAMAPNGLTTLHTKTDRHFLDPREMGSAPLKRAAIEMLSTNSGRTSYTFDNVLKNVTYRTSPLTQWKFVIMFSGTS